MTGKRLLACIGNYHFVDILLAFVEVFYELLFAFVSAANTS